MKSLIKKLKDNEQDFEWYPTTEEILKNVAEDIRERAHEIGHSRDNSILDIGAGNGSALTYLKKAISDEIFFRHPKLYAIEKSSLLIEAMPSDVYIIGTDFHSQTLIDKPVSIIFCNPPYSEYELWFRRILEEGNACIIYFVIPERWKEANGLKDILKKRGADAESIGSFDFLDADRKARAKVNIVRVWQNQYKRHAMNDPFSLWFDATFKIEAATSDYEFTSLREKEHNKEKFADLVAGPNLIERLETMYHNDLEKLYDNYRKIESLDTSILRELGVNIPALKSGLEKKISGLKYSYWKELFNHLSSITSKLTRKSREGMLNKLMEHTSVDFIKQNVYAVVIWAIKNANLYFDEQIKDVYLWLSDQDGVRAYKSNIHFVTDRWRYNKESMEKYYLDYRLVIKRNDNFSSRSYDNINGLHENAHWKINDIITIANNLGFNIKDSTYDRQWAPSKEQIFYENNEPFMSIRAYLNGNLHIKFNQRFIKKLNVEAGRLFGWIKSPEEAVDEIADVDLAEAQSSFNSNLQIGLSNIPLLTA